MSEGGLGSGLVAAPRAVCVRPFERASYSSLNERRQRLMIKSTESTFESRDLVSPNALSEVSWNLSLNTVWNLRGLSGVNT